MIKIRKCYVVVTNQRELDSLRYNDRRVIVIAFGTKDQPAYVKTPFKNSILVSDEFHVTSYSGNRILADDHAYVQVSNDCIVSLRDFATCEVYGASYICGAGDSKIYLLSDKATVHRRERNRMYRRKPYDNI